MNPYYDEDGITIYQGDCREVLPALEGVDTLLTDPPFFMPAEHYQSRIKWQRSWGDVSILAAFWSLILDALRLKETGHAIVFGNADSYPVLYPEFYRRFDKISCLVWDKGHVGLGRIWRHQHELILAARWRTSYAEIDGRLYSDVLRVDATPSSERHHPVEKPTKLLTDLLRPSTPTAGMVLDPFMGAGTTLLAAKALNLPAIGIEIEERYCEIAAKRLAQGVFDFGEPR
jgi:site-specific DNA-methyltransferase (adenine-specific)